MGCIVAETMDRSIECRKTDVSCTDRVAQVEKKGKPKHKSRNMKEEKYTDDKKRIS